MFVCVIAIVSRGGRGKGGGTGIIGWVFPAVAFVLAASADSFFGVAPIASSIGVGQLVPGFDIGLGDDPDLRVLLVVFHPYPSRLAIVGATFVIDKTR